MAKSIEVGHGHRVLDLDVTLGADPAQEVEGLVITAEQDVLAVVDELAGDPIGERRGAATELRPRIQHQHPPAGLRQQRRRAQPGEAGADHDDGGIRRGHRFSSAATHVVAAINARRGRGTRTTDENTS